MKCTSAWVIGRPSVPVIDGAVAPEDAVVVVVACRGAGVAGGGLVLQPASATATARSAVLVIRFLLLIGPNGTSSLG